MSERLMSIVDLQRVTGMKRYSKQVQWFKDQFGVNVVRSSDGAPVVTWATFEGMQAKKAGLTASSTNTDRPALRPAILRSIK